MNSIIESPEILEPTTDSIEATKVSEPAKQSSGIKRLLVVASLAMAVALPIGVYPRVLQSEELHISQSKAINALPQVTMAALKHASPVKDLQLPGSLEAVVEAELYARADGFIKKRYVDIGDKVSAGQLLADIETPEVNDSLAESKAVVLTNIAGRATIQADIEQSEANYQKSLADLAQAKTTVAQRLHDEKFAQNTTARWKKLAADGAVSLQDAEEKETIYNTSVEATQAARDKVLAAQADVSAAKAHIGADRARLTAAAANIQAAQARSSRSTSEQSFQHVVAPFSGVITARSIDQGSLVSAGTDSKVPLFKLERIDTLKVYVDVPQYSSSAVKVGQAVAIAIREFPGRQFSGKVARTSVSLDATARTMKTEIHIANPGMALAPGMFGEVKFTVPRAKNIFLIPSSALVIRSEGPQVVTIDGEEIAYKKVQLGDDLGKEVEIISGLSGSEKLVDSPSDTLRDGTKVATRN
ncbi:efflux RND transporter periplasmic adaptor subunit [soil metagenome]